MAALVTGIKSGDGSGALRGETGFKASLRAGQVAERGKRGVLLFCFSKDGCQLRIRELIEPEGSRSEQLI
jgi:hypothetical protein